MCCCAHLTSSLFNEFLYLCNQVIEKRVALVRGLITGYDVRPQTTVLVTAGHYIIKALKESRRLLIPVSKIVVYPNGARNFR